MAQRGKYQGRRTRPKAPPVQESGTRLKAPPLVREEEKASRSQNQREKVKQMGLPTAGQLETELKHEQYRHRYSGVLRSTIYTLIVVAALSVLVATLFLPVLQIYGTSMTPTVTAGDIVVSVKGSDFQQGDLISFYYQNSVLIKRVIATAGDWVDIDEDGNVYVNGALLDEPYLEDDAKSYGTVTIELPFQVPEDRIFVMGDHRSASIDSRTEEIGCVAEEYIIGKIIFRIWPLNEFGSLG